MAEYRFRLATLLKLRVADREQRQIELAQAQEAERLLAQQADSITEQIAQAKEAMRRVAQPGGVDVDRVLELQRFGLQLRADAMVLAQRIKVVREEVERRRVILVEADKQVKTLEKLREKQQLAHRIKEEKREQKVLDEIGQRRAATY